MDFPAEQLRAFAAVVDTGTFEAAGAHLHITPSAVSQRIKSLEGQVGTIIVRRVKPARPTPAGLVLLRLARQLELLANEAAAELSGQGVPASGSGIPRRPPVSIVVNADSLATWFPSVFVDLAACNELELEILREDETVSAELLRAGRAMAAVTTSHRPVQGCTSEYLGSLPYKAMASPQFARTWFDGGAAAGLSRAPVVNFDKNDTLQASVIRSVAGRVCRPPVHHVPDSSQYVRAVAAGLGWGMIPSAQDPGDGTLVVLDEEWVRRVGLYWQRWKLDSPALERVSGAVRRAAARPGALDRGAAGTPPSEVGRAATLPPLDLLSARNGGT